MMKKLFALLLIMIVSVSSLHAGKDEDLKVLQSAKVLKDLLNLPENAIPPILFKKAYAIAIIPSTMKVGFILGGQYGNGVICVKDDNGIWGNPVFITLMEGSVGFQLGASSSDLVLAFKTKKAVDGLITSKLTLGVDASVAAGPVGREVGVNGDIFLEQEVYTYAMTKGLYAGISLAGSSLIVDEGANHRFYGTDATPTDIFNNYGITAPPVVKTLKRIFNGY
jgi:lipid-binding SYLF domain-containing protein